MKIIDRMAEWIVRKGLSFIAINVSIAPDVMARIKDLESRPPVVTEELSKHSAQILSDFDQRIRSIEHFRNPNSFGARDEIFIGLQARVKELEGWMSTKTGEFNLLSVQTHLEQHLRMMFEKLQADTETGVLKTRMDRLDEVLTQNAEFHRAELSEIRFRMVRITQEEPINQTERRIFVRLCLQLADTADKVRNFVEPNDAPERGKDTPPQESKWMGKEVTCDHCGETSRLLFGMLCACHYCGANISGFRVPASPANSRWWRFKNRIREIIKQNGTENGV